MPLHVNSDARPFREILKAARDDANLSQVELAALLDVAPRTVQYWEAGRITPQPKHRRRLAEFLGAGESEAA